MREKERKRVAVKKRERRKNREIMNSFFFLFKAIINHPQQHIKMKGKNTISKKNPWKITHTHAKWLFKLLIWCAGQWYKIYFD